MGYWAEIRNDFFEGENELDLAFEGDVLASISIDAWKTHDDWEEGKVIACVMLSLHGDILVDFRDNVARSDEMALEAIEEAKDQLKAFFQKREIPDAEKQTLPTKHESEEGTPLFKNNDLVKIKDEFHNSGETVQLYRVVNVNEATRRCYIELADCQLPLSPQELVSFDMLYLVHTAPTKVHAFNKETMEDEQGNKYARIINTPHFISQSTGEVYQACRFDDSGSLVEIEPLYQYLQESALEDRLEDLRDELTNIINEREDDDLDYRRALWLDQRYLEVTNQIQEGEQLLQAREMYEALHSNEPTSPVASSSNKSNYGYITVNDLINELLKIQSAYGNEQILSIGATSGQIKGMSSPFNLRFQDGCIYIPSYQKDVVDRSAGTLDDKEQVTSELIKAMVAYGLENSWCDSEIIDALVELGITHEDFLKAGAGDFVKNYFEDEPEEKPSLDSKIKKAEAKNSGTNNVVPVTPER